MKALIALLAITCVIQVRGDFWQDQRDQWRQQEEAQNEKELQDVIDRHDEWERNRTQEDRDNEREYYNNPPSEPTAEDWERLYAQIDESLKPDPEIDAIFRDAGIPGY
jgi:hypothetical protein